MAKRVSTRRIKKDRLYTYEEAGEALGLSAATIRAWRADGLEVLTATKPHYVLGAELIAYVKSKQHNRSVKMPLDQMFCFKCKAPKSPLWSMVDYVPINDRRGRLTGLCEDCDGPLQRFVSKADLSKFREIFDITIKRES
jgi:hypothetical protein